MSGIADQTSASNLFPFGGEAATRNIFGIQRQFARPLAFGFGLQRGPGAQRFQRQLERGEFGGPLASLIQQGQDFIPSLFPEAQRVGQQISAQALPAFNQLRGQIQSALQQLPQFQALASQGAGGLSQAITQAQEFANTALQPTRENAIFQRAAERLLGAARPGLAGRGLLDQGAGGALESDLLRNLTLDFVQREADLQSQALQNLIGSGVASSAAQPGFLGAAGAGVPIAGAQLEALPGLANLLLAQQNLPLQGLQSGLGLVSGAFQPSLSLAPFLQPQAVSEFSGSPLTPFGNLFGGLGGFLKGLGGLK